MIDYEVLADNSCADPAEDILVAHAESQSHPFVATPLSIRAFRDEDGAASVGYLTGHSMQGRLFISRLAVNADNRGIGIGAKLLALAEKEALDRGVSEMVLDTWSFQAEEFYRKLGFTEIGRLPDRNGFPGKVWLLKKCTNGSG